MKYDNVIPVELDPAVTAAAVKSTVAGKQVVAGLVIDNTGNGLTVTTTGVIEEEQPFALLATI